MCLTLHVEKFSVDGFFSYLQDAWGIDKVVYLCQLLLKPFRRTGCDGLLQFLQLLHVWEVLSVLCRHGYAP